MTFTHATTQDLHSHTQPSRIWRTHAWPRPTPRRRSIHSQVLLSQLSPPDFPVAPPVAPSYSPRVAFPYSPLRSAPYSPPTLPTTLLLLLSSVFFPQLSSLLSSLLSPQLLTLRSSLMFSLPPLCYRPYSLRKSPFYSPRHSPVLMSYSPALLSASYPLCHVLPVFLYLSPSAVMLSLLGSRYLARTASTSLPPQHYLAHTALLSLPCIKCLLAYTAVSPA
jgi:hypothetical protein